ncbi:vWA domain-containing protein [Achromobacter sp. F4_2707]|uniref:vWA domain-containing protein n=1 Tax=Achromobacter sp. F4_2707 TaxID=3114286 RepID=UPI0039C75B42
MKITSIATALLLTFATTIASAQMRLVIPLSLADSSSTSATNESEHESLEETVVFDLERFQDLEETLKYRFELEAKSGIDYNIAVIIDTSASTESIAENQLASVNKLIDTLMLHDGNVNFTIVCFDSGATSRTYMFLNRNVLPNIHLCPARGNTNYSAGFLYAETEYEQMNPYNPNAEKITYFLTDGYPNLFIDHMGGIQGPKGVFNPTEPAYQKVWAKSLEAAQPLLTGTSMHGIKMIGTKVETLEDFDSAGMEERFTK